MSKQSDPGQHVRAARKIYRLLRIPLAVLGAVIVVSFLMAAVSRARRHHGQEAAGAIATYIVSPSSLSVRGELNGKVVIDGRTIKCPRDTSLSGSLIRRMEKIYGIFARRMFLLFKAAITDLSPAAFGLTMMAGGGLHFCVILIVPISMMPKSTGIFSAKELIGSNGNNLRTLKRVADVPRATVRLL
jgi:hypothetical protein